VRHSLKDASSTAAELSKTERLVAAGVLQSVLSIVQLQAQLCVAAL